MADRKRPFDAASCKRGSDRTRHVSHLMPLSVHARSVFCKVGNSCPVSPSGSPDGPSLNLKVEFTNKSASVERKRRLDDLCLDDDDDDDDDDHDTPPQNHCLGNGSSPDSACDLHSHQVKLVSPQSSAAVLDGIRRIDKTLSDQEPLGLGWLDCTDPNKGQSSKSLPAVHSSSPVILHSKGSVDGIAFDYDVDEIMCLSPIDGPDGQVDFIQSYQTYEEQLLTEVVCNPGQNRAKAESLHGKVSQTESDEGYVTKSFDKTDSKDMTESEIAKSGQVSVLKSYQITIPNWPNDKAPPASIPVVSTPLDNLKDVPSVGQQPPAYKGTVMIREKIEAEDCFEITLPLQVQVALANTEEPEAFKAPAHQQPEKTAASEGQRNVIPRPVVLYKEKEWEKEKKAYVSSVTRHISENGEPGVMTELSHLMNAVANQGRGSHGRRWQHPSDLTRRNYRLPNSSRFLSLNDWQNKNYRYRRRFAKVPPVFQRSPVL